MAGSMTPKHQTLVSTVPLSPQFHLASAIRRDFLGCGTHLRPPGLRTRRTTGANRKLGFPIQSPRCLFQNSTGDDAVLVVAAAVATFAILRLVYTDYNRRRRRDNPNFADEEQFGIAGNNELYKQDEGILGEVTVGIRSSGGASFCIKPFEREDALERTCENLSYEKADKSDQNDSMHLESQSSVLALDENLHYDVRPAYKLLAYAPVGNELPKANGFEGPTSPLVVNEVKTVEEDNFEAKLPFFLPKVDEILAVSSVPIAAVEPSLTFSVVSTEKKTSAVDHGKYVVMPTATKQSELLTSSYNVQIGVPAKEVFDCMEGKQHALKSIPSFKSLSPEPFHLKVQDNTNYRHHTKYTLEVPHIVAKASSLTAEYLEAQNLIGALKEDPVNKGSEMKEGHCSTRDIGRSLIHESTNGNFPNFPQQNGYPRDEPGPATYIRTYNHMLRDGRLRDCMDLLEKMETKGLLDMNKVNHKMFLKACKSQKAVKEAFRFCKLIQNSTLSTFNMLLSVCASSQDFEGAFQVMLLVKKARLKPDCKLYTTLISTCAKSGNVDAMFEVFHEMVSAGVEPNVNTYGALIDGCARAGQVAKAFGAYGIMRSKKVQPDRVIFNALITACGQSGAVHRAFDVLAEMMAEPKPVDPDHVTVGALIKTCIQAGQVDRVPEIYKMLHKYNIKGTPDVYTIAVNSCSQTGNLEFALSIYNDMKKNGVTPDEMFLSTIIDVAGHSMKIDTAFEILQDARNSGMQLGDISYSSLMGACCNAKNWQKALELYEEMKTIKLLPTVSTLNALMTSLCDGDQLLKSVEVLDEIREAGVQPNSITYSVLVVACEKKNEADLGFTLLSKAKEDGILLNLIMSRCLTGLCLKSLEKAYSLGEPIVTFNSGKPQIDSKWTTLAIMVYRETISARVIPTIEVFSQVLGCLQFPRDPSIRNRFIENLGVAVDASRWSNICSLLDGFGEYDIRCFSVLEEAASLGVLPRVSFKDSPIVVDARKLPVHTVEVYLLMILKGLKHRLAAGARLPNINILLPTERTQVESSKKERRTINLAGRTSQAVCSLLRRMGIPYSGDESFGKIRIIGLSLRRWFKPKLTRTSALGRPGEMIPIQSRLGKGISDQQRSIRNSNNLSLE